jgi:hypothetical protein
MIRQQSAWGQFWADLSEQHRICGCGIVTPLQTHLPPQPWKKAYHGLWFTITPLGAVYKEAEGDTMIQYLQDGLRQWGVETLRMKVNLLAVAMEEAEHRMSRYADAQDDT